MVRGGDRRMLSTGGGSAPACRNINERIQTALQDTYGRQRTIESIKAQRKSDRYKIALRRIIRSTRRHSENPSMHQDDPITPGSNTRPTSPENNRTSSDIDSLNDGEEGNSEEALASLLNSPEVHHLSAAFAALIQVMLKAPTTTTTAKSLLNATARFLTTHFADKPQWTMPRTRDPSLGAGRQNYVIHQHLFHKDRARLLDLISGKSREWHQSANPKEIAHLLAQRISKHSLPDTEPFSPKPQRPAPHGLELISEAEGVHLRTKTDPASSTMQGLQPVGLLPGHPYGLQE
ncbi:hypothetical protein M513_13537 [Trichuris suis]|uniref:Uncharacterized protein n=1 Tax=Trichuris suis TaxID=68888 RepID=A0A085LKU4_9BILA|nr:hypothetical protein M513_13537 [Trichuris suis]